MRHELEKYRGPLLLLTHLEVVPVGVARQVAVVPTPRACAPLPQQPESLERADAVGLAQVGTERLGDVVDHPLDRGRVERERVVVEGRS
jgi:hypothetical protein